MNGKKRVMFHATSSLVDVSECEQSWADDDYNNINNGNMLQHQQSYHDPTGLHHDERNGYKQVNKFQRIHIISYLQKIMCTACGEHAAVNNVYAHKLCIRTHEFYSKCVSNRV
jgi:hypothetical protein